MIVVKINEMLEDDNVRVEISVGETDGNAFSFTVEQAGVLKMRPEIWEHLKKAIQKGARRPLIVLSEDNG